MFKKVYEPTQAEKWKLPDGYEGGLVVKSLPIEHSTDTKVWYNPSQTHTMIIGTTGSGKTQSVIMPSELSIASAGGSMVIIDPKAENYSLMYEYLKRMGYTIYVMDYAQPMSGTCFNQMFMVNEEYEKGLPHYYASKAIDSLLKLIDIITSNGTNNKLKYFKKETYEMAKGMLPRTIQEDCADGRFIQVGMHPKASTSIFRIGDSDALDNEKLTLFLNELDLERIMDLIKEVYESIPEQIEEKFNESKLNKSIESASYNNEFLKERELRTVEEVNNTLKQINLETIKEYYLKKKAENLLIIKRAEETSSVYITASENIKKYDEMFQKLDNNELTIAIIRNYLEDLKADHEFAWATHENSAAMYAGAVAELITGGDSETQLEPIWPKSAKALQKGLIMLTSRESFSPFSKHLGSIDRMMSNLSIPDQNGKTDLDRITDRLLKSDTAKLAMSTERIAPDKMKGSILGTADSYTKLFGDYNIVDQCARHDFNPETLATKKTAVFLIIPPNDETNAKQYQVLSTLFIEQVYSCLKKYAAEKEDQTLTRPVYFLADECCNIPPIPALGAKVSLARSYNIRWEIVYQSTEQLETMYKNSAETIKENCNMLYLLSNSKKTASELSERIGKATVEINSYTSSVRENGEQQSINTSTTEKPLYTPQDLMQLPEGSAVYIMSRHQSYETQLLPCYKWPIYEWLQNNKVRNVHVRRNPQPVNFFEPDPQDFTFAYESLAKDVILDKYVYDELKELIDNIDTPRQSQLQAQEPTIEPTDNVDIPNDEIIL